MNKKELNYHRTDISEFIQHWINEKRYVKYCYISSSFKGKTISKLRHRNAVCTDLWEERFLKRHTLWVDELRKGAWHRGCSSMYGEQLGEQNTGWIQALIVSCLSTFGHYKNCTWMHGGVCGVNLWANE